MHVILHAVSGVLWAGRWTLQGIAFQDALHGEIAHARMLLEVLSALEFVLEGAREVANIFGGGGLGGEGIERSNGYMYCTCYDRDVDLLKDTHRCTIFMHRMAQFMILGISSEEEALLTHVEVETFETTVSESNYRVFFADIAFGLKRNRISIRLLLNEF